MSEPIDLGHGHVLRIVGWHPDRSIPSNAERFRGIPDIARAAAIVDHPKPDGTPCLGACVHFDTEEVRRVFPNNLRWTVESWDPLTLSPSLLCSCGDHGFIREGRWVPA